jgi:hypothetical protein
MGSTILATFGIISITTASILLILIGDWRYRIALLAFLYAGVFALTNLSWPITMSMSKLIAGWIGCTVLGMALISTPKTQQVNNRLRASGGLISGSLSGKIFNPQRLYYFISSALVLVLVFFGTPTLVVWLPGVRMEQVWGALTLIGMGLLQLGFNPKPFPTTIGVLTILAGFEIIYAAIENSILVASLVTLITLGVSLVGAYLILSPQMEED